MSRSRLLLIGGAILTVVGTVWSLQGASLLGGSAMTDDRRWLVIGIVTVVAGILLAYRGTRSHT